MEVCTVPVKVIQKMMNIMWIFVTMLEVFFLQISVWLLGLTPFFFFCLSWIVWKCWLYLDRSADRWWMQMDFPKVAHSSFSFSFSYFFSSILSLALGLWFLSWINLNPITYHWKSQAHFWVMSYNVKSSNEGIIDHQYAHLDLSINPSDTSQPSPISSFMQLHGASNYLNDSFKLL